MQQHKIVCYLIVFVSVVNSSSVLLANLISTSALITCPAYGRLGDQIILYAAAKFLSLRHGIPFLYKHHKDLGQLVLDEKELFYDQYMEKRFERIQEVTNETDFNGSENKKILYLLPLNIATHYCYHLLQKSISHESFLPLLRSFIKPKRAISKILMPENMISVAVHIRKGSSRDTVATVQHFPSKFTSDKFCIDQIKKISNFFNDQKMYVYLFTDYNKPLDLKQQYMHALADKKNIVVDCRESSGDSILNDLFSMVDFDCLICSRSHFSTSAEMIGKHKLVVLAIRSHWDNDLRDVMVDEIDFSVKDSEWCKNAKKQ